MKRLDINLREDEFRALVNDLPEAPRWASQALQRAYARIVWAVIDVRNSTPGPDQQIGGPK